MVVRYINKIIMKIKDKKNKKNHTLPPPSASGASEVSSEPSPLASTHSCILQSSSLLGIESPPQSPGSTGAPSLRHFTLKIILYNTEDIFNHYGKYGIVYKISSSLINPWYKKPNKCEQLPTLCNYLR